MPKPKRKFSDEYRLAAVEQVWDGKSVSEVAAACGLHVMTLYHWIRKLKPKPPSPGMEIKEEGSTERNGQTETEIRDRSSKSGEVAGRQSPVRSQRKFSKEFKKKVVREIDEGGSVVEIAAKHGIVRNMLYRWYYEAYPERKQVRKTGIEDFKAAGKKLEQLKRHSSGPKGQNSSDSKCSSKALLQDEMQEEVDKKVERIRETVADPLIWLQKHTQTKDSHWREAKAPSPYRPFPEKLYFGALVEGFLKEPVLFLEKSRDMMISWLFVGLFTHAAMTNPGIEVLFQSQKEEKALELVGYAKTLYKRQSSELREVFPLKPGKPGSGALEFANGSRIIGIPGGGEQIRSYHPWALFQDEAAFMPEAGEAYDHAVPVCEKIVVVSSAGPGWFSEQCQSANDHLSCLTPGLTMRRMRDGRPVYRVHYSADPERGTAWVIRERKKYSSQGAWDREQEIIHEAGGGERLFADVLSRYAEKILIDPYTSGFQPSPYWKKLGGFDHGKANPTGVLVACIDYDGVIYIVGEYYQPGLSPAQHKPNLLQLNGFMEAELYADPSIFYQNQAQEGGKFKAISELYAEAGIRNLIPAPETHELLGMERILAHWHDLDNREPTLKIVCPREKREITRPIYGVHNDGCPNLLWELRRARREELSATQLLTKNPTEKIVDRDNHLRDPLKYLCLALPTPTDKPGYAQMQQALTGGLDMTSFMAHYGHLLPSVFKKKDRPIYLGGRALFRELTRGRRRRN